MGGSYTLEWLDYLVTVLLNPARTNLEIILPEQISLLESKIEEEKIKQQSFLKNKVFSLLEENKISLLIRQYHSTLIILLDQAFENNKNISDDKSSIKQLTNTVIICIDEILSFIQNHFPIYVGMNARVPVTCLSSAKKEVKQKTDKFKAELRKIKDKQVPDMVLNKLYSFSKTTKANRSVTFQEMFYVKELLKELEVLENEEQENEIFTTLDKILIYLNFNSKAYLNYITHKIANTINDIESIYEKIDYLQFHFKEFNQLHRKAGIALYPQQVDLKDAIGNWLTQEIIYLENKLQLSNVPLQRRTEILKQKKSIEKEKHKVLCVLSTDQMAIILRALDELKVLKARSMSDVFKTVVPHLSTPFKEELSYDSVRSKSYVAEERDKKVVIETLQQVMEKIKRY